MPKSDNKNKTTSATRKAQPPCYSHLNYFFNCVREPAKSGFKKRRRITKDKPKPGF